MWCNICIQNSLEAELITLNGVSKLSTHHSSLSTFPVVITYSTPHIVQAYLHSAFICNVPCQSQLAKCARSCWGRQGSEGHYNVVKVMIAQTKIFPHQQALSFHQAHLSMEHVSVLWIPSHLTPASREWSQLLEIRKIGELLQASIWFSLPVHCTSSSTICSVPWPK